MSRIDGYLTKNERSEDLSPWITSRVYQLLRFAQKVVLILSLRLRWDCLLTFFTSEASMSRIDGYVTKNERSEDLSLGLMNGYSLTLAVVTSL
jgi:hypothetical protein